MKTLLTSLAGLSLVSCGLLAQSPTMSCENQGSGGEPRFCEIRESTIPALSALNVDGRQNGGISIKGANRSDILVRAMVQARGTSDAEAKSTGAQVMVHTSGGTVQSDGPSQANWSVSYEIFVPANTGLHLTTKNGGISISGVESTVEFHAVNGGISLKNVGGNVHGDTVNGGVSVNLANARWNGQGLDVQTTNGGVSMKVPEQFSALLDIATVNGGMNVRLPNAQIPRGEHHFNQAVGAGGALIRVRTHNGGVNISSPSSAA
ncbi:MAG TPA: DUF4097 family beta strand repeat-containing protein [Bryobacteraceae bacterium]|nr:DUF4097 family beta strand repeat-containing protein [Bryobacteraceae bacterium]